MKCYKSENHVHEAPKQLESEIAEQPKSAAHSLPTQSTPSSSLESKTEGNPHVDIFQNLLKDSLLQQMLKSKTLQHHLLTIQQFLVDPKLANEHTVEGRRVVALKKLRELRAGGVENNIEVEEFVLHVLDLMERNRAGSDQS